MVMHRNTLAEVGEVIEFTRLDIKAWQMAALCAAMGLLNAKVSGKVRSCQKLPVLKAK